MKLVKRRAGWVLTLGLLSMLGWSLAVSASMPSWFDPDYDCGRAFPQAEGDLRRVDEQWLPPRAGCDFGSGEVHQFISTTRSTVLTVVFALTAALTVLGLHLVLRRLWEPQGILRSAEAVDLRRRKLKHLGLGAGATLLGLAVFTVASVFAAFLGGPPGMVIVALFATIALSAVASTLDREYGPLPSTARDSRRRGTLTGCVTFTTVFVLTVASGKFPFYQLWIAPVGALTYLVVTGLPWSRQSQRQLS
ncbi:hypothetical protein [Kribbella sp. CA-293567]|uniref:hypothetical protein n=1 Tax=Kribbella sp. CA-293567 TaxID=3002436 RepID=UPI0022DD9627|nr:hypothetical protein [Kribbella sp. CA-293567]WBQ06848.1 hypothetical protein OX958_08640 [Kribbella sp. CA-293567]